MQALTDFQLVSTAPEKAARAFKETNQAPVIGTLCTYAPEEIIWAAGALPFRIWGTYAQINRADAHLQTYSCSLVRMALEAGLSGQLDFLDGVVFPHTCDSIQRLSDIWRMRIPQHWHVDVGLPAKMNTASARQYLIDVLRRFKSDLETYCGHPIANTDLVAAGRLYNQLRAQLSRLYDLRRRAPKQISSKLVQATVMAAMVMDRIEFTQTLQTILDQLEPTLTPDNRVSNGLILSGGMCRVPEIHDIIEQAGGFVLGDDLCSGERYFGGTINTETDDPLAAIAERYYSRVVCPAKHHDLHQRANELTHQVTASGARGVLFLYLKFCDPHLFDYPYLKKALDDQGIPSMMVEIEEQHFSQAQFRTRCEAFLEMLE